MITDHASLVWLRNLKDPSGRLGRWALRLQPYDFTLIHRKGKFMVVADALSRAVETIGVAKAGRDVWYDNLKNDVVSKPDKYTNFSVKGDILYKHCSNGRKGVGYMSKWREVVPLGRRLAIMQNSHDVLSAHGGVFKTADRVKREHYWPKMDKDIRQYVAQCEVCKACKPTNEAQRSPMGNFRECTRPFEMIYIDFIGPLPRSKSGFAHMLVVVDAFTKFVHVHPLRNATTLGAVKCLREHIFLVFGTPRYLICDNGAQFTATAFKAFLEEHKVTSWFISRYHPQANAAEAANKTIETAVKTYLLKEGNHRHWDSNLLETARAVNTSAHSSTSISPYFALFGLHMRTSGAAYVDEASDTPLESHKEHMSKIRDLVSSKLRKSYEQGKRRYDLRTRPIRYEVGEMVWVKNRTLSDAAKGIAAKLAPKYRKCTIKRKIGTNSYEVTGPDGGSLGIFNTYSLKK